MPAAIDGQIGEDVLSRLQLHFGECPPCLHEFELEQMTKNVVRRYARSASSPAYLRERIVRRVRGEGKTPEHVPLWRRPVSRAAIFALGGAAVALLLLLFITPQTPLKHSHTQPADADVVHQTYNNYDGVLSGKLRPEVETNDPVQATAFFGPMADFKVQVPSMHDFRLVGAMCSHYDGKCIAQLVYRGVKDIVYLYEVNFESVIHHTSGFRVSPEAIASLQRTGWYFENHTPECSLAMWVKDSTLCCAIADVRKDVLLASLTENP